MSLDTDFAINSKSLGDTLAIAGTLARKLQGGEVIELIGDLGAGKTVFVRGLAKGISSPDLVQSPTFTIQRIYRGKKVSIHHYDFHRLDDAGVLKEQLQESLADPGAVTVIEWSHVVRGILPTERLQIKITPITIDSRRLVFAPKGSKYRELITGIR